MGIWYYCSNIVADEGRLIEIIGHGNTEELENERDLVGIFGNKRHQLIL